MGCWGVEADSSCCCLRRRLLRVPYSGWCCFLSVLGGWCSCVSPKHRDGVLRISVPLIHRVHVIFKSTALLKRIREYGELRERGPRSVPPYWLFILLAWSRLSTTARERGEVFTSQPRVPCGARQPEEQETECRAVRATNGVCPPLVSGHSPCVAGQAWPALWSLYGSCEFRPVKAVMLCSFTEEYTLFLSLSWIGVNLDEGHEAFCFCQGETCWWFSHCQGVKDD